MAIERETIERILDLTDIVDLIGEAISIQKRGANYVALCPFHNEKTPSFTISPERQFYKCFGCGVSGNAISFMMEYHKLSYPDAIKELGRRVGIQVEDTYSSEEQNQKGREKDLIRKALITGKDFYKHLLFSNSGDKALKYLTDRGFTRKLIKEFELGYSPDAWNQLLKELYKKGFDDEIIIKAGLAIRTDNGEIFDRFRDRVMFPILDHLGQVVGFGARILSDVKGQAKYINSPQTLVYDKSKILYGLYSAKDDIRRKGKALLTEGYADVLALHQAGFKNTIASSGTSLTKNQLNILFRYCKEIYIVYDADSAGIQATIRGLELALEHGFEVKIVKLPIGEDPDSIIQKQGANSFQAYLDDAVTFLDFIIDLNKENQDLNSPAKKSEVIRNILKIITKIPDRLQHDDYINILRWKFNITEQQLRQIYREKEIIEKTKNFSYDNFENKTKLKSENVSKNEIKTIDSDKILDFTTLMPAEKILLELAVNEKDLVPRLLNEFKVNDETFISETGKIIFNEIVRLSSKDPDIMNALFEDNEIDINIKNLITDFAIKLHKPSEHWKEFSNIDDEYDLDKMIIQLLKNIELSKIKLEMEDLKNKLKNCNLEEEIEILNSIKRLTLRKSKLNKL